MHIGGRTKMDEHGRNAYRWLWVGEEIYGRTNKMTRYTDQLIDVLRQSRKAFTPSDITRLLGRYVTPLYMLRPMSEADACDKRTWEDIGTSRKRSLTQRTPYNDHQLVQLLPHTQNTAQITPVLQSYWIPRHGFYPNRLSAQFPKENCGFSGSRTWVRLLRCLTISTHHNHHTYHRHLSLLPAQPY
jgi:hypothetical protein